MTDLPLSGVRVLDIGMEIGSAYASKLLADLGATVLMVEPPAGHPLRRRGPYPGDKPHPDRSGLFIYYCSNKQRTVVDIERPQDRRRLLDLAAKSDIVIESFLPGRLAELGLDYLRLSRKHQALVLTSLTHFGQTGRWRHWQGEEIVSWALSGYMYFGGDPQREPLMVNNNQTQLHAGAHAAMASLAALWWARRTGQGQHVDVSAFEVMLTNHLWTSMQWTHEGIVVRRTGTDVIRCKDGWVHFAPMTLNPNTFVLIGKPELATDPRFLDTASWRQHQPEVTRMVAEWCMGRGKWEIWHLAQELQIPCAPVLDAGDLTTSEALRQRSFFLEVEHPAAGRVTMPGFPYVFSDTPLTLRSPAPTLDETVAGWPDHGRRPIAPMAFQEHLSIEAMPNSTPPLPLRGLRIIEITNNWAGPVAGRNLADLGAEVIKIESPTRIASRIGHYAGGQPFRYHYNRVGYHNKMNRNKYGVTLDLSRSEGKALFLRMVKDADVVIENNSPRVMRNLELDYQALRQVNPDIVMAQISGFGQTGPLRDYVAYGANIEASCGLAAVTGYVDDERPYRTGHYYADPVTATHTSIAVLAALFHRQFSGRGQHIDLSLQENAITFLPEALLEYTVTGQLAKRRGNRHWKHAPQGCYPSLGNDMWMVLCIRSDTEWRQFVEITGDSRLTDERFSTEANRMRHHEEIDRLVTEWSRRFDHNEASAILQKASIPAAPVLANWEMVSNLHAYDRGFYAVVPQREMGAFPQPGVPWKLSATPGRIRMAGPDYGEHNRLVFGDYLKLGERDLARLYQSRVIADEPPPEFLPPPAA